MSKNNDFGIEYPTLDLRKEKFIQEVLKKLLAYGSKIDKILESDNLLPNYSTLSGIIEVETPINYSEWNLDPAFYIIPNTSKIFKLISAFKKFSTNYVTFLSLLNELMKEIKTRKINIKYDNGTKQSLNYLVEEIIYLFEQFDLDYLWNKKSKKIERKVDKINSGIIIENVKNMNDEFKYESCVDEFLHPHNNINKNHSLNHIKLVLESVAKSKGIQKPFTGAGKNKLIDSVFPGKKPEYFIPQIDFIINKIYQPLDDGVPYRFTEQEYVYWWLEINKIIFMINSHKASKKKV